MLDFSSKYYLKITGDQVTIADKAALGDLTYITIPAKDITVFLDESENKNESAAIQPPKLAAQFNTAVEKCDHYQTLLADRRGTITNGVHLVENVAKNPLEPRLAGGKYTAETDTTRNLKHALFFHESQLLEAIIEQLIKETSALPAISVETPKSILEKLKKANYNRRFFSKQEVRELYKQLHQWKTETLAKNKDKAENKDEIKKQIDVIYALSQALLDYYWDYHKNPPNPNISYRK